MLNSIHKTQELISTNGYLSTMLKGLQKVFLRDGETNDWGIQQISLDSKV